MNFLLPCFEIKKHFFSRGSDFVVLLFVKHFLVVWTRVNWRISAETKLNLTRFCSGTGRNGDSSGKYSGPSEGHVGGLRSPLTSSHWQSNESISPPPAAAAAALFCIMAGLTLMLTLFCKLFYVYLMIEMQTRFTVCCQIQGRVRDFKDFVKKLIVCIWCPALFWLKVWRCDLFSGFQLWSGLMTQAQVDDGPDVCRQSCIWVKVKVDYL